MSGRINAENKGMRVNMNKAKVIISGALTSEASAEGCKMALWCIW